MIPVLTKLELRDAEDADIPAIVALVQSTYRGESSRKGWTTEADLLDGQRIDADAVAAELARSRSRIRLAFREGELVACAHVAEEDDAGHFGMFSVRADLQGAGVGTLMLADAERVVHEDWGLPMMRMSVIDVREELIAFYQRRGYRRTGIKLPFPYGDARFGLPRRDDLRFEILEKSL